MKNMHFEWLLERAGKNQVKITHCSAVLTVFSLADYGTDDS